MRSQSRQHNYVCRHNIRPCPLLLLPAAGAFVSVMSFSCRCLFTISSFHSFFSSFFLLFSVRKPLLFCVSRRFFCTFFGLQFFALAFLSFHFISFTSIMWCVCVCVSVCKSYLHRICLCFFFHSAAFVCNRKRVERRNVEMHEPLWRAHIFVDYRNANQICAHRTARCEYTQPQYNGNEPIK